MLDKRDSMKFDSSRMLDKRDFMKCDSSRMLDKPDFMKFDSFRDITVFTIINFIEKIRSQNKSIAIQKFEHNHF